jgi:hypothetical protein
MPDGYAAHLASSDEVAISLHRRLSALNHARLTPCLPDDVDAEDTVWVSARAEEAAFLRGLLAVVCEQAACAPTKPDAFLAWFEALRITGPGQGDYLFPWLAAQAPLAAMRWFLQQEVAGEAGFEDLTALTQLRMPVRPKLEMARNYWDEMGRGQEKGVHGLMLEQLARSLGWHAQSCDIVWQSLALANAMAGMAANRRFAFHSVGALGVIELTAPGRAKQVAAGLKRLGVAAADRHYFDLHAVLDVRHAATWNAEIIVPLIAEDPRRARAIAEGALIRLACGAACFARYRAELGVL